MCDNICRQSASSHGYRYNLAEKVNGRLEEMGKDLSSMIEEINDASSSLNKNNKPDDPVSLLLGFCYLKSPLTAHLVISSRSSPQ